MCFQLESSPALALLHKRYASILISFFHKTFSESNIAEVLEQRLEGRWEAFIEEDVFLSEASVRNTQSENVFAIVPQGLTDD